MRFDRDLETDRVLLIAERAQKNFRNQAQWVDPGSAPRLRNSRKVRRFGDRQPDQAVDDPTATLYPMGTGVSMARVTDKNRFANNAKH
ncbi:MAG TPA: hypothetical protein PKC49_04450 [Phycisphaerae bacterium]|nr:hypothetical protein [Phycisphaerae bacterium]